MADLFLSIFRFLLSLVLFSWNRPFHWPQFAFSDRSIIFSLNVSRDVDFRLRAYSLQPLPPILGCLCGRLRDIPFWRDFLDLMDVLRR